MELLSDNTGCQKDALKICIVCDENTIRLQQGALVIVTPLYPGAKRFLAPVSLETLIFTQFEVFEQYSYLFGYK